MSVLPEKQESELDMSSLKKVVQTNRKKERKMLSKVIDDTTIDNQFE